MNDMLKLSCLWVGVLLVLCGVFVYHISMVNTALDLASQTLAQYNETMGAAVALTEDQAVLINKQAVLIDRQDGLLKKYLREAEL